VRVAIFSQLAAALLSRRRSRSHSFAITGMTRFGISGNLDEPGRIDSGLSSMDSGYVEMLSRSSG